MLTYRTTWFDFSQSSGNIESTVKVNGREYHALAFNTHHFARCKIGHEKHIFAHQFFGLIVGCYTTENGTVGATAIINGELQEFFRLLYMLTSFDMAYTDVQFLKVFKANRFFDGGCLVSSGFIGFLGSLKFVELLLDGCILNLFEQQFRFAELMA